MLKNCRIPVPGVNDVIFSCNYVTPLHTNSPTFKLLLKIIFQSKTKFKMKKLYPLLIMLVMATTTTSAQNPVATGQSQINAGVGFSGWGIPLYVGLDYGIHKDITIGGEFSFRSYGERYENDRYNHSIFGFSGNANYHFNHILNIPLNWDLYAGLRLGFYYWNSNHHYNGRHSSGLGIGAQVGGRYYFTDNIGINLELGGSNAFSGGKVGISIKL
jgi:hypothetical protein